MEYVTYNESGALTGNYSQDLSATHADGYIEVTSEQRKNWTAYRANDARDGIEIAPIEPDEDQFPIQKALYLNEVRALRDKVLFRLNGYGAGLMLGEPPSFAEEKALVKAIIDGLLDITTISGALSATTLTELQTAIKTEYARLVGLSSDGIKLAFRKLDL